jgi:2-polyprenyl-6-methoxyphenol hydroxylase-like FAD-dependent oxidoreductase
MGDAAHVMTPLTGVSVNLAMQDSYDLALAIVIGGSAIDTALDVYEKTMFARASENVEETRRNQRSLFSGKDVEEVVRLLIRAFSGED